MTDESRTGALDPGIEELLAQFWNAIGQGAQPDLSALDPALVETVWLMHRLDATQSPEPEFVDQMREKLFVTGEIASPALPLNGDFRLNGRHEFSARQVERQTRPFPNVRDWRFAIGAVAALLLILGIGYVVFGSGMLDENPADTVPAAIVPTATPTPGVISQETLLVYTIPAAELPRINIGMGTTRNTIAPGKRSTWQPYCCPGPMLEYVIAGTYTIRAEAPVQVVRADGTSETVPAGIEVTLGPGDALISRNETVVEAANTGLDTVHLLNWTLVEDTGLSGHLLPGWTNNRPEVQGTTSLGDGPAKVTLQLIELDGGANLPAQADGEFQFMVAMPNLTGTRTVTYAKRDTDGSIQIVGEDAVTIIILTLEPSGAVAASPVADKPPP